MKKFIAFICSASILLTQVCASAEFVFSGNLNTQATLIVEGEDLTDFGESTATHTAVERAGASGGKVLQIVAASHNVPPAGGTISVPHYDARYVTDITEYGTYNIWVRIGTNNSIFFAIDGGKYSRYGAGATANTVDSVDPTYTWRRIGARYKEPGDTLEILIAHSYAKNQLDKIVITTDNTFQPSGNLATGQSGPAAVPTADTTLFYPIAGFKPTQGHPRVYITEDKIAELRENAKQPEMANFLQTMSNQAHYTVTSDMSQREEGKQYLPNTNVYLRARAMWYLLGYANEAHARKTIEHCIKYLKTSVYPDIGDITRSIGDQMEAAAIVYDWLYDLLTENEKKIIIAKLKDLALQKEIGYPPVGNEVYGHDGEREIFWDMLSAGIAIYDEDPEIFNLAAGMYEKMVPSRQLFNASGNHPSGDSYGTWRLNCELMSEMLLKPLGVPLDSRIGKDVWKVPLRWIYSRKPTGGVFREGDTATPKYFEYQLNRTPAMMALIPNLYPDAPYSDLYYGEWLMNESLVNWASMPFYMLILWDKDNPNEVNLGSDMPLTYYSTYPLTQMYARTSWQKGIDAPTAMAYMQGREKLTDIHDHPDLGSFQIFYKGMLANDSVGGEEEGYKGGWLTTMDANWARRSISHNLVTVKDPEEVFFDNSYIYEKDWMVVSNDGGQDWHNLLDARFMTSYEDLLNRKELAKTEGIYVGPNEYTPEFSYLQTDITNAYSGKRVNKDTGVSLLEDLAFENVSGTVVERTKIFEKLGIETNPYEDFYDKFDAQYPVVKKLTDNTRSMVFIDLFNDDYPAAFICFDKVDSTNANFEKNWLLHMLEQPTVSGNTTIVTRKDFGFNGKMVVKTMLPENLDIEIIGGEGKSTWVDGKNYGDIVDGADEGGGWRIEISPSVASKQDLFLNAMYVTDYDRNLPELPMYKEESGNYVGVTVMDRVVMFAKDAEDATTTFTLNIRDNNNGGDMSVMVADVAPGVWTVSGGGKTQKVEVTDEQCALYFKCKAGAYTITKADGSKADKITYPKAEKPAIGDYQIYGSDGLFRNQKSPTKLIDGVPYLAAVDYLPYYGAKVTENADGGVTVKVGALRSATLFPNSKRVLINGQESRIENEPKIIDGKLYINLADIEDTINCKVTYDQNAYVLKVTQLDAPEEDTSTLIELVKHNTDSVPTGTRIYANVKMLEEGQRVMFIKDGIKADADIDANFRYYTELGSGWHEITAAICDKDGNIITQTDLELYFGVDLAGEEDVKTNVDFSRAFDKNWTSADYEAIGLKAETTKSFASKSIASKSENGNGYVELVGWGHKFTDPKATFDSNGNLLTGDYGNHTPDIATIYSLANGAYDISFDWRADRVEVINKDGTISETRYFADKTKTFGQILTAPRYSSSGNTPLSNNASGGGILSIYGHNDSKYSTFSPFTVTNEGVFSAVYYEGNEKKSVVLDIDPAEWNNFRVVIDTNASKIWLYVNGVIVATGDARVNIETKDENGNVISTEILPIKKIRTPYAQGIRIYGNVDGEKGTVRSYTHVDNFVFKRYNDGVSSKPKTATSNATENGIGIVFENFAENEKIADMAIISQTKDNTYEIHKYDATNAPTYKYFNFNNLANRVFIWSMGNLKPIKEDVIIPAQ